MKVKKSLQIGQFVAALILIVFVVLQITNTIKINYTNIILYILLIINIILVLVNMITRTEKDDSGNKIISNKLILILMTAILTLLVLYLFFTRI